MKNKFPKHFSEKDALILKNQLPIIKANRNPTLRDHVTTKLRWVLHPQYDFHTANTLLLEFIKSTDSLYSKKDFSQYNRDKRIRKGIWENPLSKWWLSVEYYFLDFLMRNAFVREEYCLTHQKWTAMLDTEIKTDLLTTLTRNSDNWLEDHVFWTQIAFLKMHQSQFASSKTVFAKEKMVYDWITQNEDLLYRLPLSLRPEIPSLVRVNSEGKENEVLMQSFTDRSEDWFTDWWPTKYLPDEYRYFFKDLWHYYQRSCKSFLSLTEKLYSWNSENDIYEPITDYKFANRLNNFDKKKKRIVYDIFYKKWRNKKLMTMVFRITDAYERRIRKTLKK